MSALLALSHIGILEKVIGKRYNGSSTCISLSQGEEYILPRQVSVHSNLKDGILDVNIRTSLYKLGGGDIDRK